MLASAGQPLSGEPTPHDPTTVFGDDPGFADAVRTLVFGHAPRLFAVLHEVGHREDAWVAAWGLAFDDHVEVVDTDGRCRMSLGSAETACAILGLEDGATAHLFWLDNPSAAPIG